MRRLGGATLVGALLVGTLAIGIPVLVAPAAAEDVSTEDLVVTSGTGADEVGLDATLYLPASAAASPAPAIVLGHGFGGSKDSVTDDATAFAEAGYVVLAYSARGFGESTGQIGLNAPDYEIADLSTMLDLLADRDDVATDSTGDPVVGVAGASYGGALSLLGAAYDQRIDAIIPQITWNSLTRAFFPDQAGAPEDDGFAGSPDPAEDGVFKKLWAGLFFASGSAALGSVGGLEDLGDLGGAAGAGVGDGGPAVDPTLLDLDGLTCGRFRPEICAAYQEAAISGRLTPSISAVLDRSSPAGVLDRIEAPTMLVQGMADTLFPLSEADANARGIAANGTPVKVVWYRGGHDGGTDEDDVARLRELSLSWFDFYLKGTGADPGTGFEFPEPNGLAAGLSAQGDADERIATAPAYPGLSGGSDSGSEVSALALNGPPLQPAVNPAGGLPAAISTIPGIGGAVGGLLGGAAGALSDIPGQAAIFSTEPLEDAVDIVGSVQTEIAVSSPTGEAVLFAKLYDTTDGGTPTLLGGVAPLRLTGLPADPGAAQLIPITLAPMVHRVEVGYQLRLVLSTTDQGYASPTDPAVYTVAVGPEAALRVPDVSAEVSDASGPPWWTFWVVAGGLAVILAIGMVIWGRRGRRHATTVDPDIADIPLVVRHLTKRYPDGLVAVKDLSFSVTHGQVVGLLGPNGAGKTTALRQVMGLIRPTEGEIRIFGHEVAFGAPVLSRVGSFVEGTGLLPHLSGRTNLELYWAATGRPAEDAHLEEVLEIAGLGNAVHKRVRTYSQGMRQRIALAQAMLGLPDLLILDEPTNGLDPPQIREMRDVIHRYVEAGRTVLISSHMLAEVEQTCTDVVVMHNGALVAQGTVEEIIGTGGAVLLGVDDRVAAQSVLDGIEGVQSVSSDAEGIVVDLDGYSRSDVVGRLVGAGVGVDRVVPRRRLEDAFITLVSEERP